MLLPAGDAYAVHVADGSALFDSIVIPVVPNGGMTLHLDIAGWHDIKLESGTVYDLPGDGVATFVLFGDPPSLEIGLLFQTADVSEIGDVIIDSFEQVEPRPGVSEPTIMHLSALALSTLLIQRIRRRRSTA
jgi:hypothetical protein